MGARQYSALLGRFLEVDPIQGGSANDYDYVNGDPVNGVDLSGTCLEDLCVVEGAAAGAGIYIAGGVAVGIGGWLVSGGHRHVTVPHVRLPHIHLTGGGINEDEIRERQKELVREGRERIGERGQRHSDAARQRWREWYNGLKRWEKKLYRQGGGPMARKRTN
jgi:hypothetical protein